MPRNTKRETDLKELRQRLAPKPKVRRGPTFKNERWYQATASAVSAARLPSSDAPPLAPAD
jgi:hypothetical protein